MRFRLALPTTIICFIMAMPAHAADAPVNFARDVLPVLSDNCFHCHGPDEKARKAKLRLDTKEGAFRVDDAVIVPGKSASSELVRRILSDDPDEQMPPPDGVRKLTPAQQQILKRWVDEGAKWGTHWAFEPPTKKPVPAVQDEKWVRNDTDRFIRARLQEEGIAPQIEADKARLIRRATFDLTGLPPTVAEIEAFIADQSPHAYEKLLDRLLASPRYGERMAADWLDIARFADTHGYQMDRFRPMHAYRDWVIKAFNENLPFDQFATWQLAGDLLPNATKDQRLATAFNRLHSQNEEGGIVEEEFRLAYVVDRVNTMGTAFLGMTFECTRCHDHKYDPITQKEYYQLFSFFQNIDESGQTTYFTTAMPVPTMLLSTDEQDAKLADLEEAIERAEREVDLAMRQAAEAPLHEWYAKRDRLHPPTVPGIIAEFSFDSMEKNEIRNGVDEKSVGKASDGPILVDGPNGGKVARLSGENGFTFPRLADFSRVDPFTLQIKVRLGELAERAVVLHKSRAPIDAGSRGFELLLESGHVAFGLHHMWPGNSLKVRSKKAIEKDKWTMLTVTYDGSSRAAGVRIYVDGENTELEVVRDGLWKDITYGGDEPDLAIGFRFRDNGFRNGEVDDFSILNRVLTSGEVRAIAGPENLNAAWSADPGTPIAPELADFYINVVDPQVAKARKALHAARKAQSDFINLIPEAMVMKEMPTPKPAYLLKRGNYNELGEPVSAGTPATMPPFPADQPRNRLGLARWLTNPHHPLTARVTVNRLWQQMFGRGLVETADNFGSTGSVPTHPELLDYLARTFVDDFKWDQKRFLKYIAMSATYRQSSQPNAEALAKDPTNQLLSHMPARRLTAEMLRDQALATSGLLVEKLGGPSVKPYQPDGLWDIAMGRPKYDQGHGEDLYRRSLYTYIKRTVAPPAMLTFDAADRSYCTIQRQTTSTPLQSLVLLNDVQIVEAARKVAERMLVEGGDDDRGRARWAFSLITGRSPTDRESAVLISLLQEQRELFTADKTAAAELLKVGESKPDEKLNAVEVAAACVLVQAILNHDDAVMRR